MRLWSQFAAVALFFPALAMIMVLYGLGSGSIPSRNLHERHFRKLRRLWRGAPRLLSRLSQTFYRDQGLSQTANLYPSPRPNLHGLRHLHRLRL